MPLLGKLKGLLHHEDDEEAYAGSPQSPGRSQTRATPHSPTSSRQSATYGRSSIDRSNINNGSAPRLPETGVSQRQSGLMDDLQNLQHLDLNKKDAAELQNSNNFSAGSRSVSKPYQDNTIQNGRQGYPDELSQPRQQRTSQDILRSPVNSTAGQPGTALTTPSSPAATTQGRVNEDLPIRDAGRRSSVARKPIGDRSSHDFTETTTSKGGIESKIAGSKAEHTRDAVVDGVDLKGVLDLSNSVDTTVHETIAPAVVHEHIETHIHHVREERIQREIHTHDVFHRILPIKDIQVLPARHFIPGPNGTLIEVSEESIYGRTGGRTDWLIAETASKLGPTDHHTSGPRKFTAREFHGTDGDYTSHTGEDGIHREHTTWVHPPELEQGGRLTGQTEELII